MCDVTNDPSHTVAEPRTVPVEWRVRTIPVAPIVRYHTIADEGPVYCSIALHRTCSTLKPDPTPTIAINRLWKPGQGKDSPGFTQCMSQRYATRQYLSCRHHGYTIYISDIVHWMFRLMLVYGLSPCQ